MATFYVSSNDIWVPLDILEKTEADTDYVNLVGDTMAGTLNAAGHRVTNAAYSGAGPAGALVSGIDASTVQYVDDLVTVSTTPGVPSTVPLRDGQVWLVTADV